MICIFDVRDQICDVLGEVSFSGADSHVWIRGKFVYKLVKCWPTQWKTMRILCRHDGPYVKTHDMRIVGRNGASKYDCLVGWVVQERVPTTCRSGGLAPGTADHEPLPPCEWDGGADMFSQSDGHGGNAGSGKWFDLVRIEAINSKAFPHYMKRSFLPVYPV
tara:strand:+ start:102 stop:587 length:486 start_codon:yes stop_codon:yes gene_type:complete